MTRSALMDKASRALASARLLLDAGDTDGACNRACYAMFDAAKAALATIETSDQGSTVKTHSGLISAFSLRLVKSGKVSVDLGKALNRVAELRQAGDYTGVRIPEDKARWAIDRARDFVEAIEELVEQPILPGAHEGHEGE